MYIRRLTFLLLTALLAGAILGIHTYAMATYAYWQYRWLDIVVHFMGGVEVAMGALWLYSYRRPLHSIPQTLVMVGVTIFVIGIGWEIFEVWAGVEMEANYFADTSLDLVMDTLGALFGTLIAWPFLRERGGVVSDTSTQNTPA